jgi:excisionase family DNA binding protein
MVEKMRAENGLPANDLTNSNPSVSSSQLWTIDEVAGYLQLKSETVRAMARQQEIPAFKIRRRWRFRKEDIELWVKNMAQQR